MASDSTTQEERAIEVHVDDFAPFGRFKINHIESVWSACGTCVVDDDVDTTELFEGAGNECIDSVGIGNVAHNWNTTLAKRTDFIGNRFNVSPTGSLFVGGVVDRSATGSGDDDITPRTRQFHGNWPTNRTHTSGTGDDCDLAG